MQKNVEVLATDAEGKAENVLVRLGKAVNGRQPVRFIANILDPNGPPIPIYPDGTFPAIQRPGITGTPSGSVCPVGPGHVPPTAEEMAKYCRCSVDQYLARLPYAVAALNGQAAPPQAIVDDWDPLADSPNDWTAQVPPAEAAGFAHWQQHGKGPNRDARRWAGISAVVKSAHQKAAKAAAK